MTRFTFDERDLENVAQTLAHHRRWVVGVEQEGEPSDVDRNLARAVLDALAAGRPLTAGYARTDEPVMLDDISAGEGGTHSLATAPPVEGSDDEAIPFGNVPTYAGDLTALANRMDRNDARVSELEARLERHMATFNDLDAYDSRLDELETHIGGVGDLESRVDDLETQTQDFVTASDLDDLDGRVSDLEGTLRRLGEVLA